MTREDWLVTIVNAALDGGKEILEIYNAPFSVETKADNSPITQADKNAHMAIVKALEKTNIPILSEEGEQAPYSIRKDWKQFWMVDPLDGTKEFVNRNGEFTVNIALIEDGKPTMGVIYIPITQTLYFADKLAYKIENFNESTFSIHNLLGKADQLPLTQNRSNYIVLASRSHMNETTTNYINQLKESYPDLLIEAKGSSLKLCTIAEGSADIYPRFAPTMEWDIAAGHAIVNAAGGRVINWETNKPLQYNKQNLLNPSFVVDQ